VSRWATVKLGEVAQFINGDRGKNYPSEGDFVDRGIAFINAGHLSRGTVDFSNMNYITESRFRALGSGKTRENDILYCLRGSLGKTAVVRSTNDAAIASSLVIIRATPACDIRYLYHFLVSPLAREEMRKFVNGSSQPNLSADSVKNYRLLVPPLSEQRRIAAILDKADDLRAKRRAALDHLNGLIRAIFLDMFGDPTSNPKGFSIGSIESLVKDPRGDIRCGPFGTQLKVHEIVGSGVPLFGIENVLDEGFKTEATKFLTDTKANQLRAFDVVAGDVLVTRMGTIGRACVVPTAVLNGRFSYHLFRIRPDVSRCDADFLAATIAHSGTFQSQLKLLAHGAIMDGLSTANLRAVRFVLPPVSLQREFARRVAKLHSIKFHALSSKRKSDELFSGLQHRAFRGEL
jgi:type I restriction enzyme, S subunit